MLLSIKLWWWLLSFWSRPNIESCHPSLQCEQRGHEFLVGRLDGCKTQHVKEAAGCDPNWRVGHCDPAVHKLRKARLQSGNDAEHFVADGLVVVSWEEQSSLVHLLTMRLEGGMEKAVLQEHLVASLQGDRLILIPLKSKQAARLRPSDSQARLVQESLDKMQAIPGVDCDVHEFAIVSVEREGPPSPAVSLQDGKTKHPVKTKKVAMIDAGCFSLLLCLAATSYYLFWIALAVPMSSSPYARFTVLETWKLKINMFGSCSEPCPRLLEDHSLWPVHSSRRAAAESSPCARCPALWE